MSTDGGTKTLREYVKEHSDKDPQALLDLVIAESERARAAADKEISEQKAMSDVLFVPNQGLVPANLAGVWRMAIMYSNSQMVPTHFRGKPYDCAIAIQMAIRCKVDPMAFMQKCYIVHGRPSIESTLAIAMANTSGIIKGRITYRYEGDGDNKWCVAMATLADTGELIQQRVGIETAKKMGWWGKSDSLWPKMPDLMLQYRSAMWLIRAYFPEVLMGIYSVDEMRDGSMGGPTTTELGSLEGMVESMIAGYQPPVETTPAPAETAPAKEDKADLLAKKLEEKRAAAATATTQAAKEVAPVKAAEKPAEEKPKKTATKAASKPKEAKPENAPAQQSEEAEEPEPKPVAEEVKAAEEKAAEEPAQTVASSPPTDRKWTADETVAHVSEFQRKLKAAADCEEADAHFHFDIEAFKGNMEERHFNYAVSILDKRKAVLIREEKDKSAGDAGTKPANTQQTMLEN